MSSRGYRVLKFHKNDWLMIVALVIMEGILLHWVPPFYRFIGKDMMTDLKYPFKSNTVPFWAIPVLALVVPILVFLIYYFRKRNLHDLHQALLGLLFSVLLTAVITDFIKSAVGRPRPDFFWRCFPDGIELYDKRTHNVKCTGNHADIKEGHKSFPSGHTSGCFAGLGYLSWYLAGKINLFNKKAHARKLCIVFLPLLIASLVGISRVDDYWHHWQDVFAGGLLGFSIATLCYRQFFPAPYHLEGMLPYPFFPEITEQHLNERENTNALHQQNSGAQNEPFRTGNTEAEEREGIEGCKNNRSSDTEIEMIRSGARSNPTIREVLETKASLDNV